MGTDLLSDFDLHLFSEGHHWHLYNVLGAHPCHQGGTDGVRFSVWAPYASGVSVVGSFNDWDGDTHPLRRNGGYGVWSAFVPGVHPGARYQFAVRTRDGRCQLRGDPMAQQTEHRPGTASVVADRGHFPWGDGDWLNRRAREPWSHRPLSIYELHPGSWRHHGSGRWLNWQELAEQLVPYVLELGFTHIELMPVTEHPLDESWGYQTTGYYAPTARYGSPDDFRALVNACHRAGLGVILDWVPGHFPDDPHGLARFDGTALYEHDDPRLGRHEGWGTLVFNYGRNEVRNFLIGSALFWLDAYHVDGLRVDAVASMLYLDYDRPPGDWLPNLHGGRENLEAIGFLRELNNLCHQRFPGVLMIAEESTSWPGVTHPQETGGLGFDLKWNMGWMHDTLDYLRLDPIFRQYHHDRLTFGLMYAFTEQFLLPLSHDEVVHGKGSLLAKMSGDRWQQRANLRLLLTLQFTYPGAKLLFMGGEFGQWREWSERRELDWHLLADSDHAGFQRLVQDLNRVYAAHPALYLDGCCPETFRWIDCHDSPQSVISFLRQSDEARLVVVFNFTPVPRRGYRIGLPAGGVWRECLNSDSAYYGGSNLGNAYRLEAEDVPWMSQPYSVTLSLPPLAALILEHQP
ncbi:1,4-alpha-glucan branching protein GlgB [Marinobacter sp. C2H3]|uniref:1,4-alpha-glucan branching protein GlgB n=1 Tax=Marinobacter sp. C2H3 TaxID=3119003 RepID=UPI00300EEA56